MIIEFFELFPIVFFCTCVVLGLVFGSFLNVVSYRLPIMLNTAWHIECVQFLGVEDDESEIVEYLSLSYPRSHCQHCKSTVKILHNIPLFSYLILGGKCAECHKAISSRYPLIELLTAILFVIQGIYFGPSLELIASCILTSCLICLSMIDLDHQLLPDQITLPLIWIGLNLNVFNMFTSLGDAVIGATIGYMSLWTFVKVYEGITGKFAMGNGDFKLLACAGAWLGWQQLPFIVLASSIVGSIIGVTLIVLKHNTSETRIPFGPYLAVAIWIALLWGDTIMLDYYNWVNVGY